MIFEELLEQFDAAGNAKKRLMLSKAGLKNKGKPFLED